MTISLFDGTVQGDDRIKMVIGMMGHHPDEIQSEVMCDFVGRLLSKVENIAMDILNREIAECMRGEAARRVSKRR